MRRAAASRPWARGFRLLAEQCSGFRLLEGGRCLDDFRVRSNYSVIVVLAVAVDTDWVGGAADPLRQGINLTLQTLDLGERLEPLEEGLRDRERTV